MSDNKKRIPKWLSSRLFSLYAIPMCLIGFILYVITGVLQLAYTMMVFIVEGINYGWVRWNYIEWDYLKESMNLIKGIWYNFKILIVGERDD